MVKDASTRTAAYQNKVDPTVITSRITALSESMKANGATAQAQGATIALNVRGILNQYSITGNFANTFHAFANELGAKARKYTDAALAAEGALVMAKWKSRMTISGSVPTAFNDAAKAIAASHGLVWT